MPTPTLVAKNINPSLFRACKIRAVVEGLTLRAWLIRLVEREIEATAPKTTVQK
jgi:hypothetical protein